MDENQKLEEVLDLLSKHENPYYYNLLGKPIRKSISKMPISKGWKNNVLRFICPTCKSATVGKVERKGSKIVNKVLFNNCSNCGQKINKKVSLE